MPWPIVPDFRQPLPEQPPENVVLQAVGGMAFTKLHVRPIKRLLANLVIITNLAAFLDEGADMVIV